MPFLSRKKAVPAAPTSPARPPPPSTGLDISSISSPTPVISAPSPANNKQYTASNQSAAHYPAFSQDGIYPGNGAAQSHHHAQALPQSQYQSAPYVPNPSTSGHQYMAEGSQYAAQAAHPPRPKTSESQRGTQKRPIPPPVDTSYQNQPQYRRTSSMDSEQSDNVLYDEQDPNERSSSGATTMSSGSKFGSGDMQQQQNSYLHGDISGPMSNLATDYSSMPDAGHQQIHASAYGSRISPPTTISHQHGAPRALAPAAEIGKPASVQMAQEYSSSTQTFSSPSLSTTSSKRRTASRYALGDFHFIRTLGTGSFGRVHLVRSCHNTRFYAIKVLSKDRVVQMKQVEHTNSEREMLERVRHPFLVNLWGTFKDARNLYMVMDFVSGGELFSLLRKSQRFPDPVAKFFAAEVALALDYLHSLDIIYRDLKPENILLASDGHIKVTDFGFAKYVPDITWTLCGTPDYLAPEIVQSRGYNKSVDWYALGVLMFEMLAGYPPFFTEDSNPMRLYEKIIAGKIRYPAYFTIEAKDLLRNLLTSDLTKRFGNLANGSRDVFAHSWFGEVDWERLYRKEIPAPYVPRVAGEGDASAFESYPETQEQYGQSGPDPHGHLFALF